MRVQVTHPSVQIWIEDALTDVNASFKLDNRSGGEYRCNLSLFCGARVFTLFCGYGYVMFENQDV